MPPNIVQIQSTPPATRYIHYRKGDRVFEPGMLIDGFYTVIQGRLQAHHRQSRVGRAFREGVRPRRAFRRARAAALGAPHRARRGARRTALLLFIAQKDFTRFARAFPFLDNYFKDYIERTFGGADKSFAPGSTNSKTELETLP